MKFREFVLKKNFLLGILGFVSFLIIINILFHFYKPLIIFSDSVNFRFAFLDKTTDISNIFINDYISFIYDYTKDKHRLKIEQAQGKLFVKKVVCLEGHELRVDVESRNFFCDDVFIGKARDKFLNGENAPLFIFNGVIPEGYFFVEGDTKYSFDSRYWGFVRKEEILGKVIPIF